MNKNHELYIDMAYFIGKYVRNGEHFTIKDICTSCEMSFDNRADVQKIYSVILNWRNTSKNMFNDPETIELLKEYETAEDGWDAFIGMLNAQNIFLLFSMPNDGKWIYYQPDWIDKEMLDFGRMCKHVRGQITVLDEMTVYGEEFPKNAGLLVSPKELVTELKGILDHSRTALETEINNKIKELESAEELQLSE